MPIKKDVFFPRASFKERGIKLIEEKVKPAFKKIHDYYFDVSKLKIIHTILLKIYASLTIVHFSLFAIFALS